jgi:hypothetical protein
MDDKTKLTLAFLAGFIFGLWLVGMLNTRHHQTMAVKYGAAQYNAKTGDFEWKLAPREQEGGAK